MQAHLPSATRLLPQTGVEVIGMNMAIPIMKRLWADCWPTLALGACIVRVKRDYASVSRENDIAFTEFIRSVGRVASKFKVQMEDILEAEKELAGRESTEVNRISETSDIYELVMTDEMKVKEVMDC